MGNDKIIGNDGAFLLESPTEMFVRGETYRFRSRARSCAMNLRPLRPPLRRLASVPIVNESKKSVSIESYRREYEIVSWEPVNLRKKQRRKFSSFSLFESISDGPE